MARRTQTEILIGVLATLPSQRGSVKAVSTALGWDVDKTRRVAERAVEGGTQVFIGKGGTISFRGSERGAGSGIYSDVARVICTYWGPRVLRLRNIDAIDTSRSGRRGGGVWTHPDLVIAADPVRRSRRDEPRRLHAVEVETEAGFDLRSVYQAHSQGRGADYSWVFGSRAPGVTDDHWDRVLWTAEELNVGLVTFTKPHAFGTWTTHRVAGHNEPSSDEREAFIGRALSSRDCHLLEV